MAQSGDFVTPRLNGIKYFEKPALRYGATATSFRLFGEHGWSARPRPALTGFFGLLFTAFCALRHFGAPAAIATAAVLRSGWLTSGPKESQCLRDGAQPLLPRSTGARVQLRHRGAAHRLAPRQQSDRAMR